MKLKNKKTGEIATLTLSSNGEDLLIMKNNEMITRSVKLSDLEEWEDYEEPKDFWFIDPEILIACESTEPLLCDKKVAIETMKQIGNYFETREEAEEAVEKLKAWKRLKDKGFRFTGINDDENSQELITQCGILCEADIFHLAKDKDFLLLFGGEE